MSKISTNPEGTPTGEEELNTTYRTRGYKTRERALKAADLLADADMRRTTGRMPARPASTGKYKKA